MTPDEQLINEQHLAGILNGETTGNIVSAKFSGPVSNAIKLEIRKITDAALAHVIDALKAGGIKAKYRTPFAAGFRIGLRRTLMAA